MSYAELSVSMIAVIADDVDQTVSRKPERQQAALLAGRDLRQLIRDDRERLGRDHPAKRREQIVDEGVIRKVARDANQHQEGREEREEEVVRELRRHPETVVLEERLVERAPQNLRPRQRHFRGARAGRPRQCARVGVPAGPVLPVLGVHEGASLAGKDSSDASCTVSALRPWRWATRRARDRDECAAHRRQAAAHHARLAPPQAKRKARDRATTEAGDEKRAGEHRHEPRSVSQSQLPSARSQTAGFSAVLHEVHGHQRASSHRTKVQRMCPPASPRDGAVSEPHFGGDH
jgi:hypothetical protein